MGATEILKTESFFDSVWAWVFSGGLALLLLGRFWDSRDKRGDDINQLKKDVLLLQKDMESLTKTLANIDKKLGQIDDDLKHLRDTNHAICNGVNHIFAILKIKHNIDLSDAARFFRKEMES